MSDESQPESQEEQKFGFWKTVFVLGCGVGAFVLVKACFILMRGGP